MHQSEAVSYRFALQYNFLDDVAFMNIFPIKHMMIG